MTKLAAENLVRAYAANFGLRYSILRYYSVYGPRQRPDMGYHIFIDAILRGKPVTLYGDGTQLCGNTYVTDAVAANLAAMAHGPTDEAFNIGGGEEITANDLIARLETLIGQKAAIHCAPTRPGEQVRTLADISKARRGPGVVACGRIGTGGWPRRWSGNGHGSSIEAPSETEFYRARSADRPDQRHRGSGRKAMPQYATKLIKRHEVAEGTMAFVWNGRLASSSRPANT